MKLTDYERERLDEIRTWQDAEPGWGTRLLARPGGKAAQAVQAMIPVTALRAALANVNGFAARLTDDRALLRRAGVQTAAELRAKPLEVCDALARTESRRAMAMGGAGGLVFGMVGFAGLIADVPTLLTLALRTIHRVGQCYGAPGLAGERRADAIGIFALASANSLDEKRAAITALSQQRELLDAAWRDGVERVAERELAKEAAVFSVQTLASRIGLHLGQRKAGGVVPVLGAAIGASVNAWYLRDIAQVAQFVAQERWLAERYGTLARTPKRIRHEA